MATNRPITTLFMLSSVDGKISTGDIDQRDVDKDFPKIAGIKEGLYQYYNLEKKTDFWSLNTGRVMSKIGLNEKKDYRPKNNTLRFVIIDNKPHLKKSGITYLTRWLGTLYLITNNKKHPAFEMQKKLDNLIIIYYPKRISFENLFAKLKNKYGCKRLTIQSGGSLNAILLRKGLIDHISVVIAPALIGGRHTSTLIDGESLRMEKELSHIKALKLKKCAVLKHSYLHILYDIINKTKISKV